MAVCIWCQDRAGGALDPQCLVVAYVSDDNWAACTRKHGHKGKHISCSIAHGMHPVHVEAL